MPKEDLVEMEGKITSALGGGQYQVVLDSGQEVRGKLSGKMKVNRIRVLPGDKVTLAMSPYDLTHGLITYRHK